MLKDPELRSAVENLRRDRSYAEADIAVLADSLHRNETSLLAEKGWFPGRHRAVSSWDTARVHWLTNGLEPPARWRGRKDP